MNTSNPRLVSRFVSAALLLALATPALGQGSPARSDNALPPAWQNVLESLIFYGDFRLRLEGDWNRPGADDRRRTRLRLRMGVNYSVSEDLLVGARITTGPPDDPRDTNATLGDGFNKLELGLDRLFFSWHPASYDPFFLTVGKFAHPFARNPVFDELVWYSDVQPEGTVLGQTWRELGPLDSLRAQLGYYVFSEEALGDVNLTVAELSGSSRLSQGTRAELSAAWYGYSNAETLPAATASDYEILDVIASLTLDGGSQPLRFAAEGISNLAVSTPDDTGWALGLSYGSARKEGDWRAYYQYQEVGNDAVFTPVANFDFLYDSNFRGHVFNLDYLLSDKSTLRLRVLSATPLDPALAGGFDEDSLRVRLEFNVKF